MQVVVSYRCEEFVDRQPVTIKILSYVLLVAALLAFVVAASLVFPLTRLDRLWDLNKPAALFFRKMPGLSAAGLAAIGITTAIAAVALTRRRIWGWWYAVLLFTADCVGGVVRLIVLREPLQSLAGIAIAAAFLYAITRRRVRCWFNTTASGRQNG
jgi:hypothetical protein